MDVWWEERMCHSPREPGASSVSSAEELVDRCEITDDEARMLGEMLPRV